MLPPSSSDRTPDASDFSSDYVPHPYPYPRCRLILLFSPDKELMFFVRVMMEVLRWCREEAMLHMWEAYRCGATPILRLHPEHAEWFATRFEAWGVHTRMEPAS